MMEFKIGQHNTGISATSSDALSVTSTLAQTPSFQRTMSNPLEREAFLRGIESRKEKALTSGDKTMYGLLSALTAKVKNYTLPANDIYSSDEGFRAIG